MGVVRRREVVVLLALCVWLLTSSPAAAADAPPRGYEQIADRLVGALERWWVPELERYDPGHGGSTTVVNANLLVVYAVAAQRGLTGRVRNDARARSIARFLTTPPIWRAKPPVDDPKVRGPGWADGTGLFHRHPVHDSETAEALAVAYGARAALALEAHTVARIRQEIARVARGPDYAWPATRLNQFNWSVELFAADAHVNGATATLANGLARHLRRFLADGHNLGPGLRFRYLPQYGDRARANIDSPEYANIVLGFSRHYATARTAGMPTPRELALLRDWTRRALAGYWTHAGYLNWDTGLGFGRWHQRKKVALAQRALIGIATTPELQFTPEAGAWAKWLLDRGLEAYTDLLDRFGRLPAGVAYGVHEPLQHPSGAQVAAARYAGNAARALAAGLATAPASPPPALYSYDPDTGKLAISTAAYNTSIVPVDRRAFPYGGLDLTRLFDADQEVAADLGGTDRASFGLQVRSGHRTLLRTQYGERAHGPNPLRFEGLAAERVHAGAFTDVRVHGSVRAHGLVASSAYRFTPTAIGARWTARGHRGRASVTFPSWGRRAYALADLCDGRTVALGRTTVANICGLEIRSARSGYRVTPSAPATARLVAVRPERSNPNPGPSVEVDLGRVPASFAATLATISVSP
jgi:hypothetical protein